MKTDAFKEKIKRRNAIEGSISERAHGLRRARARARARLKKVALQNYLIGAACNAKRWVRRVAWEAKQATAEAMRTLTAMAGAAAGAYNNPRSAAGNCSHVQR